MGDRLFCLEPCFELNGRFSVYNRKTRCVQKEEGQAMDEFVQQSAVKDSRRSAHNDW